ncbi:MAG: iron-containing alcohol dehydrogenase [Planctomycetota bacterium]|nr:MAG: iron-containing alcohol dehydrogenase [Planctomycetota bacterium]
MHSVNDRPGIDPGDWDFVVPPQIHFGCGRATEVGAVAAGLGQRAWLIGGQRSLMTAGHRPRLEESLRRALVSAEIVAISAGEPTVDQVAVALAALPGGDRQGIVVVAVGGGSAIDLAKAIACLATNLPAGLSAAEYDQGVVDRLEGVGRGIGITVPPLPVVALPTTAGTGAEATRNAVISCPRRGFKKSMRSPLMVPRAVIVDPDLTRDCDRQTTAAAGLDCITQLIESFICRFARPLPRSLVLDGLPRAVWALPRLLSDPGDSAARAAMSHAALLSGMALANSGLGMAHGVAAALGVECGTPHGVACGLLLPVAIAVNAEVAASDYALLERAIDPKAPAGPGAAARFIARIEELSATAGLPRRLADVGLGRERIGWLAENSAGSSLRGNPRALDTADLEAILAAHY